MSQKLRNFMCHVHLRRLGRNFRPGQLPALPPLPQPSHESSFCQAWPTLHPHLTVPGPSPHLSPSHSPVQVPFHGHPTSQCPPMSTPVALCLPVSTLQASPAEPASLATSRPVSFPTGTGRKELSSIECVCLGLRPVWVKNQDPL